MPFYKYESEDGEIIERLFNMSNMPEQIVENNKTFSRVPEFGGNFILKGQGWASKGTALASKPKHGKEVGIAVDNKKKAAMKAAGEKV